MIYDVYYCAEIIGQVRVSRIDLYYEITCRIKAPENNIFRLIGVCEDIEIDFGICLLSAGNLVLNRKIPSKKFLSPIQYLKLVPNKMRCDGEFISVFDDEEFKYISELIHAKWHVQNGVTGVIIMR